MTTSRNSKTTAPLAERVRPSALADLNLPESLRDILEPIRLGIVPPNLLLWGPPGCGKTTLARALAAELDAELAYASAADIGVKEIRGYTSAARERATGLLAKIQQATVLFLDEIHHFSKTQQDALLQAVEDGTLFLIGATTENPSFSLSHAVLSRLQVIHMDAVDDERCLAAITRAIEHEDGYREQYTISDEASHTIVAAAGGDLRVALSLLERACGLATADHTTAIETDHATEALQYNPMQYDRAGDNHYDAISALIKSMRGSNADAALYWMAYMYEAGEDPLYIARRLIIFASEDIGNADPVALQVALNAHQSYERVGRAEGWIPLSQAVTYLATAPKSNASYMAYRRAAATVKELGRAPNVPWHLRNKPTKLLKELAAHNDGEPYRYPHDEPYGYAANVDYLPEKITEHTPFYEPSERGFEKTIRERIKFWRKQDKDQS